MARNIAFVTASGALLVGGCAGLAWMNAPSFLRPFAAALLSLSHALWLWLERRDLRWAAFGAVLGPAALCAHWASRHGYGALTRSFAHAGLLTALLATAQFGAERLTPPFR